MSDAERTAVRVLLELEWMAVRQKYLEAGQPFGPERGLHLWNEFGQATTIN